MASRALVVVDMLNDFVREDGKLTCGPPGRAIIPAIQEEIRRARSAGEPVIYTCDRHRPDDAEFDMFPPHCIAGTEGAAVIDELAPEPEDIIIEKRRYDAFFGTDLDLTLRELAVEHLTLVGVCTNICVFFTAASARLRHYKVTVPEAGVASFDEDAHRHALREMEETLGCRVMPADDRSPASAPAVKASSE